MTARSDQDAALRKELEAVPTGKRLDYLAALSPERLREFKRILPQDDVKTLNRHVDLLAAKRKKPTLDSWLADARAGKAATPEAMVEVLREVFDKLRPQDVEWIKRIDATAAAGSFSKRQQAVIRGIYERYFVR